MSAASAFGDPRIVKSEVPSWRSVEFRDLRQSLFTRSILFRQLPIPGVVGVVMNPLGSNAESLRKLRWGMNQLIGGEDFHI